MSECYPLGIFSRGSGARRVGVRVGSYVLDLTRTAKQLALPWAELVRGPSLTPLLAAGPAVWRDVYDALPSLEGPRWPSSSVRLHLPFEVADYVDFYASEHHAARLGRILRPGQDPLPPAWRHQPMGYHGRSGTVVVSGTPVRRPCGQHRTPHGDVVTGPSERLDVEVEIGFVVGTATELGDSLRVEDFADHVFGVVLVNDWSARDLQSFETVPLGPFLGKSFQTSISPWLIPLRALEAARRPVPASGSEVPSHLLESSPWGLDIDLELRVNGDLLARPPYRSMYWSPAQMLAHLTSNGASVRTGDLFASGTVSGPENGQVGSLIELPNQPFLADGDEVVISATAPAVGGGRIDLGEVRGTVLPAA
ncbi:MAG TPA: fumarylacetoacetate hydrolase family protein [Mycobacteriales bacterium]|nr:fumarylacetoacetate hydrolase family protein [Mycobacteriales bacterium]